MTEGAGRIPPQATGITWRPIGSRDVGRVIALLRACLAADGGLPFAAEEVFVRERFLPGPSGAAIGGFDANGRMVAAAALRATETPKASMASAVGQVHPEARGLGIGTGLLEWIEAEARRLLDGESPGRCVLELSTESLNGQAEELFERHGLAVRFVEVVMQLDPIRGLRNAPLPAGVALEPWTPVQAGRFFEAYAASFADRPGFPGWDEATWIEWVTGDGDFSPAASFIAVAGDEPVGFVVCAREWITQVGVRPSWRRRGIGSALVNAALCAFRDAGARQVLLDVNTNNAAATALYEQFGFAQIGRRARFTRTLGSRLCLLSPPPAKGRSGITDRHAAERVDQEGEVARPVSVRLKTGQLGDLILQTYGKCSIAGGDGGRCDVFHAALQIGPLRIGRSWGKARRLLPDRDHVVRRSVERTDPVDHRAHRVVRDRGQHVQKREKLKLLGGKSLLRAREWAVGHPCHRRRGERRVAKRRHVGEGSQVLQASARSILFDEERHQARAQPLRCPKRNPDQAEVPQPDSGDRVAALRPCLTPARVVQTVGGHIRDSLCGESPNVGRRGAAGLQELEEPLARFGVQNEGGAGVRLARIDEEPGRSGGERRERSVGPEEVPRVVCATRLERGPRESDSGQSAQRVLIGRDDQGQGKRPLPQGLGQRNGSHGCRIRGRDRHEPRVEWAMVSLVPGLLVHRCPGIPIRCGFRRRQAPEAKDIVHALRCHIDDRGGVLRYATDPRHGAVRPRVERVGRFGREKRQGTDEHGGGQEEGRLDAHHDRQANRRD